MTDNIMHHSNQENSNSWVDHSISKWNDRHLGKDIFVVGSSPQVLALNNHQLTALEQHIVIGGNCTFYRVPLTYFLSSYTPHVLLASLYLQNQQLIKLNSLKEDKKIPFCEYLIREFYSEIPGLSRYLSNKRLYIMTLRNQALAMTHLAAIMGASRIIFLGIDQRNHSYFWQKDPTLVRRIRQDSHKIQTAKYSQYYDLHHCKQFFDNHYKFLNENPSLQEQKPFYYDFTNLFSAYFHDLKQYGIEAIATLEGSVIHRAGARLLSLDEVLGTVKQTYGQTKISTNNVCDLDENLYIKIKQWEKLYLSNKMDKALQSIYNYLTFNETAKLDKNALNSIANVVKKFNMMSENYEFIISQVERSARSKEETAALILLSWMLAIPSAIKKLIADLDKSLIHKFYVKKIEGIFVQNLKNDTNDVCEQNQTIVILDDSSDPRIIFDIAQATRKITCLIHPNVGNYIDKTNLKNLYPSWVVIKTVNPYFLPIVGEQNNYKRVRELEKISQVVVKSIGNMTDNNKLSNLINTYSRPLSVALEDKLFQRSNFALECMSYLNQLSPKSIFCIFGNSSQFLGLIDILSRLYENIKVNYLFFPLKKLQNFADPMIEYETLKDNSYYPLEKNVDDIIIKNIRDKSKPLFKVQNKSVAVVADLNSENFRTNSFFQPSFFKSILNQLNLILVQVKSISPKKIEKTNQMIDSFLLKEEKSKLFKCYAIQKINDQISFLDKIELALHIIRHFRADKSLMSMFSEFDFTKLVGWQFIEHCLFDFLREDYLNCLFYAECSQKTLSSTNNISGLLFIGAGERQMLGQVLTIAAQKNSIPSYGYYNLFWSKSPRYKKPIVDYMLVSDTYLFDLFKQHFSVPNHRIFIVGSHIIDDHRQKAKVLNNKLHKQHFSKRGNDKKFLVTYATQPSVNESLRALEKLINVCRKLSVYIIVKLHPNEQKRTQDTYEELIDKLNAKEWVETVWDTNLTSLIIASDLIVTLFSNVALEAAALDRHVLSIELESQPYPVDLAKIGIAISAKTDLDLVTIVPELLEGGNADRICRQQRKLFFSKNPQLLAGNTINRITNILSQSPIDCYQNNDKI